ncbi:hypothetical protein ACSBR1_005740 [Camellia fascicularis]
MSPGSLILLTLSCLYMAIYPYLTYAGADSIRPGKQIMYAKGQDIVINSDQALETLMSNVTATLLDSGNLVLREEYTSGTFGSILWQSFDYPTNNLLSDMKLGMNIKTGQSWSNGEWVSNVLETEGKVLSCLCLHEVSLMSSTIPVLESDANFEAGDQISLLMQILETFMFSLLKLVLKKFGFGKNKGQQLQLYSLPQIAAATKNFSINKKLGQGGFGEVYKYSSNFGHSNFRFQFATDPTKSKLLGWNRRFSIIEGVAQGLLYLHKYSRMRVIHRDLKASNILLDDQMNPKISDFGLVRIFGQNESEVNTNRTVGTYGYMSLEYAMNGIFSVKSDIFSFGVLLLEIVSGKKNAVFSHLSGPLSLIEHTWDLWKKGISLELTDPVLSSQCPENELLRCIHVGLLCVQECAIDRPTMSDIICMLTNVTTILPDPKRPAFYTGRSGIQAQLSSTGKTDECSLNCVSISVIEAR